RDGAGDAHDVLAAHVGGVVDDALHDAGVVAQVDEGEVLAVLPPTRHPSAQRHGAADVGGTQGADEVGAHRGGACFGRSPFGWSGFGHWSLSCRWATTSPRGMRAWPLSPRRSRTVTSPAASSSLPMITANVAPDRSAAFICAFIERLSNARSAAMPARRSSSVRTHASSPPVVSTTNTAGERSGAGNTPSASHTRSVRSTPSAKPTPGTPSGPPS